MIGKAFLFTGIALIGATALRAVMDMLQQDPLNPWVFVFAAGCIAISVGLGLTGFKPWRRLSRKNWKSPGKGD